MALGCFLKLLLSEFEKILKNTLDTRLPRSLLNVLRMFNLRPVSGEKHLRRNTNIHHIITPE